jgi:hypothetical protein
LKLQGPNSLYGWKHGKIYKKNSVSKKILRSLNERTSK